MKALAAALILAPGLARAVPTFSKEGPIVFSSAAPQAFTGTYPSLRMYFIRRSSQVEVGSALSADGISWTEDAAAGRLSTSTLPSASASSITACGVLPLSGGGLRMLYSIVSTTASFRVHGATSADGLAWANDTGTVLNGGLTPLASPKLVQLGDSSWRLYVLSGVLPGSAQVVTTRSTNEGLNWSAPTVVLSTPAFDLGASVLTDGRVRLFFTQPVVGTSSGGAIASALSTDSNGTSFNLESGFRVSTSAASGTIAFPVPVRSTDSFRWRLYYNFADPGVISTANIHTALTGAPAPTAVSPFTVENVLSTVTLTVSGEIFSSPAPTISFSLDAQTLSPFSAVTRTNDQTLSASFNVFTLTPGSWSLLVTNADGTQTSLVGALRVDFPGGSVQLVNNLLRPRTGTATSITVNSFNDGRIVVKLFTVDGRLVRTLFDADRPKGRLSLSWDGRDAAGAPVASGLYILRTIGPKIDLKDKIVVIR